MWTKTHKQDETNKLKCKNWQNNWRISTFTDIYFQKNGNSKYIIWNLRLEEIHNCYQLVESSRQTFDFMLRKILKLYTKTETNVSLLLLFWKECVFFYIFKALLTPFHSQVQAISFMAGKALPTYIMCGWTTWTFTSLYIWMYEFGLMAQKYY